MSEKNQGRYAAYTAMMAGIADKLIQRSRGDFESMVLGSYYDQVEKERMREAIPSHWHDAVHDAVIGGKGLYRLPDPEKKNSCTREQFAWLLSIISGSWSNWEMLIHDQREANEHELRQDDNEFWGEVISECKATAAKCHGLDESQRANLTKTANAHSCHLGGFAGR